MSDRQKDRFYRAIRAFDARGLVASVTSHDALADGNVLNEVKLTYDSRNQLTKEAQEHAGAATTATLAVQYGFSDATNRHRFSTQTYPNGRVIAYGFGTANALDDRLNRLTTIADGTTTLATYTHLGQSGIVTTEYPVPSMALDLWAARPACLVAWTASAEPSTTAGRPPARPPSTSTASSTATTETATRFTASTTLPRIWTSCTLTTASTG